MTAPGPSDRTPPPWPCLGWSGEGPGEWEWGPADDDWLPDGEGMTCAQPKCRRPATLILLRVVHHWRERRTSKRRWGCCAEHSYGRVVFDGQVWEPHRKDRSDTP